MPPIKPKPIQVGNDDYLYLGDALVLPEPDLVFGEAKLQYETLLAASIGQRVDLALHYRTLFQSATKDLEEGVRLRLLHLCFAYKRKSTILRFMDDLDEEMMKWFGGIEEVVRGARRDSLFDGSTTAEKESGPHFVIPTLCLAYASEFVTAFGDYEKTDLEMWLRK
ncbi:hypothetical protein EJ02DRAFT_451227 [Clathrospora elynae]|uniref:Uncharacterized protein n=1 Tax=Clathrospora elynae TaxID=706981 RepID=A0A6A5T1E6_9PLEO|nr:hypothetical protein EJ02DRAFT_451227 [Clathrospora elynae]